MRDFEKWHRSYRPKRKPRPVYRRGHLLLFSGAASAQSYGAFGPQVGPPAYGPPPVYSQAPEYYAPPVGYYDPARQAYYAPRAPYYYAYPPTYYVRPPVYYGRPAWRDPRGWGGGYGRAWNWHDQRGRDT
ncbi:MAG: hypothetical protein ACXWC1_27300, partial [Burkholderiales bacterium]